MNAPCPIEICPDSPMSTVSPAIAVTYTATSAIWKSRNEFRLTDAMPSSTATTIAALRWRNSVNGSNLPRAHGAEQAGRPEHQHQGQRGEAEHRNQVGAEVAA